MVGDEGPAESLGHAPKDTYNPARALGPEGAELAETAQRPLLGMAAYRAGHHQKDVGFLFIRGLGQTGVSQYPANHAGLMDVHLAAVGLQVKLGQCIDILSVVPDCQAKERAGVRDDGV
jgi:hypothetical protein